MSLTKSLTKNLTKNLTTNLILEDLSIEGIGNLKVWLNNKSPLTESGGSVSVWGDNSSSSNDAEQAVIADQPKSNQDTFNGLRVLTFEQGDFLEIDYILPEDDFTVFLAVKSNFTTSFDFMLSQANVSSDWSLLKQDTNFYYTSLNGGSIGASSGTPVAPDPIYMTLTNSRVASTNTFELYRNGVSVGTNSKSYANATTKIKIGAKDDGGPGRFEGVVLEVIIYDKLLSDAERSFVENYLNNKWKISTWSISSPSELNPVFDLDFTDNSKVSHTANAVDSVEDQTGNYTVTSTGSARPTRITNSLNGLQGISFDAIDDQLLFDAADDFSQYKEQEFFAVIDVTADANSKNIMTQWGGSKAYQYQMSAAEALLLRTRNATDGNTTTTGTVTTDPVIYNGYITPSEQGIRATLDNFTTAALAEAMDDSTETPTIGADSSGGSYFNGLMYQIVLFDRKLTNEERLKMVTHLSGKFQIG